MEFASAVGIAGHAYGARRDSSGRLFLAEAVNVAQALGSGATEAALNSAGSGTSACAGTAPLGRALSRRWQRANRGLRTLSVRQLAISASGCGERVRIRPMTLIRGVATQAGCVPVVGEGKTRTECRGKSCGGRGNQTGASSTRPAISRIGRRVVQSGHRRKPASRAVERTKRVPVGRCSVSVERVAATYRETRASRRCPRQGELLNPNRSFSARACSRSSIRSNTSYG